jgi:hypothetical protein
MRFLKKQPGSLQLRIIDGTWYKFQILNFNATQILRRLAFLTNGNNVVCPNCKQKFGLDMYEDASDLL